MNTRRISEGTHKLKKIIDPGVKAAFTVNMLSHFDFKVVFLINNARKSLYHILIGLIDPKLNNIWTKLELNGA